MNEIKASDEIKVGNLKYVYDNINFLDINDAILIASEYNHPDIVRFLITRGAKLHINILINSIYHNHLDIVKILISKGFEYKYALLDAIFKGHYEMTQYLVSIGYRNEIAVLYAAEYGYLEILKYLHSQNFDLTIWNNEAFNRAVSNNHLDIIKFLPKQDGLTMAAKEGHLELVKYFVSIGYRNNECLVDAACNGHFEIVQYLIMNGICDCKYDKALKYARYWKNKEIVKYLLQEGAFAITKEDQYYSTLKLRLFLQEYDNNRQSKFNSNFTKERLCEVNVLSLVFGYL